MGRVCLTRLVRTPVGATRKGELPLERSDGVLSEGHCLSRSDWQGGGPNSPFSFPPSIPIHHHTLSGGKFDKAMVKLLSCPWGTTLGHGLLTVHCAQWAECVSRGLSGLPLAQPEKVSCRLSAVTYIYIYTVYTYLPIATDNLKVAVVNHVFGILFV